MRLYLVFYNSCSMDWISLFFFLFFWLSCEWKNASIFHKIRMAFWFLLRYPMHRLSHSRLLLLPFHVTIHVFSIWLCVCVCLGTPAVDVGGKLVKQTVREKERCFTCYPAKNIIEAFSNSLRNVISSEHCINIHERERFIRWHTKLSMQNSMMHTVHSSWWNSIFIFILIFVLGFT